MHIYININICIYTYDLLLVHKVLGIKMLWDILGDLISSLWVVSWLPSSSVAMKLGCPRRLESKQLEI